MNRLITLIPPDGLVEQSHPAVVEILESAEKKFAESLVMRQVANTRSGGDAGSLDQEGKQATPNRVRYIHDQPHNSWRRGNGLNPSGGGTGP